MEKRSFSPYTQYKESRFGNIPSNWEIRKISQIISFFTGATPSTINANFFDGTEPWANISDLNNGILKNTVKSLSEEGIKIANLRISPKGSLLFSFKLSVGKVAIAGIDTFTNEAIATFCPSPKVITKYAFYAFPLFLIKNAQTNIYGAPLLNAFLIKNARLALPPLETQHRIVTFLDQETARIDTLVDEMETMVTLLQEERKTLISETVTRGIPGTHTKFKDSGIFQIDETVEEWEIRKISHIVDFFTGGTPPTNESSYFDGELPWANISDLQAGELVTPNTSLSQTGVEKARIRISPAGSLLYSFKLSVGKVAINSFDTYTNEAIATFLPSPKIGAKYAFYAFPTFLIKNAKKNIYNADLLNADLIRQAKLPLPPVAEQQEIVQYLDIELAKIDLLINETLGAIALLKEERKVLINDVVTGKLEV